MFGFISNSIKGILVIYNVKGNNRVASSSFGMEQLISRILNNLNPNLNFFFLKGVMLVIAL